MLKRAVVFAAVAAALAAPAAYAQSAQSKQPGAAGPDLVVVTITPVQARLMDEQRRESLFRAIDTNGDGAISAAEAGLNTDLMNAFAKVDRNGDGRIERQEFAGVHVNDGAQQSQARSSQPSGAGASSATSPWIEEKAQSSVPTAPERSSAAGGSSSSGGVSVQPGPLPSRSIEEAARSGAPVRR